MFRNQNNDADIIAIAFKWFPYEAEIFYNGEKITLDETTLNRSKIVLIFDC